METQLEEPSLSEPLRPEGPAEQTGLPADVARKLLSGTSILGLGVILERGCSFLANILAARVGGASTFGAYALAIATANNVTTYAAGGIGSTAIRFSGEYPRGTEEYPVLARVLSIAALVSAAVATITLWFGAGPLSKLVGKSNLVGILHWAGLYAAGIIVLECCRGFFVGQRRLVALILLSGLVGFGTLSVLPLTSYLGPAAMLCGQSLLVSGAVAICLLLYRPLQLASPVPVAKSRSLVPLLKKVWSFSLMQIAGLIGVNVAGWWLTSLVAKSDPSMIQMSFFAVAHQLRNMVALVPSLLIEGSFAEMTGRKGEWEKTPDNVMAICTYASTLVSLFVAGAGIIVSPWLLTLVYGKTYQGAVAATSFALATAVIHMGSGSASSRLSILSIKAAGLVNTGWAIAVAGIATLLLLRNGSAGRGAAVYMAAHVLSACVFIGILKFRGNIPEGMIPAFSIGSGSVISLAVLAFLRDRLTGTHEGLTLTLLMSGIWAVALLVLVQLGHRKYWLPSLSTIAKLGARLRGR